MADQERPVIASYQTKDGTYSWTLQELEGAIFVLKPKGIANREGWEALLKVFEERSAKLGKKVSFISLSHELQDTAADVKDGAKKMMKGETCIEKFVTVGDTVIMRAFFKLYSVIAKIDMAAVATEEEAIAWIRK